MLEKPIPFTGWEMRRILAGAKTQTRRCHDKPRYAVGDLLWCWERKRVIDIRDVEHRWSRWDVRLCYEADGKESRWMMWPSRLQSTPVKGRCLAYGGFKESTRQWLEVTGVRQEWLQDISVDDISAEGYAENPADMLPHLPGPRYWWLTTWDSLYGKKPGWSWRDNPMICVYEFSAY